MICFEVKLFFKKSVRHHEKGNEASEFFIMAVDVLCPWCFSEKDGEECRQCDWTSDAKPTSPLYLTPGTILHQQYQVGQVLGHGGFGITYLAYDLNLQIKVALKEYLPKDFATRAQAQTSISVFDGTASKNFSYGLDQFLDEARILAKFQHHSGIVSVLNFFRAHGTGYIAMEYVAGMTLKEYLKNVNKVSFDEALKIMTPVMDALCEVHAAGLLHRDVSPDNIFMTHDGMVKLLDFGAARFAMGERSHSLSVILKPGYAPEEQYRTRGQQGAWTDIYALCATMYRMITGQLPTEALDRIEEDDLSHPSKLGVTISTRAEEALFHGLAVRARNRYQSMDELQAAWLQKKGSIQPKMMNVELKSKGKSKPVPATNRNEHQHVSKKGALIGVLGVLGALLFVIAFFVMQSSSSDVVKTNHLGNIQETKEQTIQPKSQSMVVDHYSVEQPESKDVYAQVNSDHVMKDYAFTVHPQPEQARVRILNIKPSYQEGMALKAGKYHVEVSMEGYQTQRTWLEVVDQDLVWDVTLLEKKSELNKGKLRVLQKGEGPIRSVAVSSNGLYFVSAGNHQNLVLWDAKTGKVIRSLKGHVGVVNVVRFSKKGGRIAAGGEDHVIRIWNVKSGKLIQTLKGHSKRILDLAFTSKGKLLSVAQDQTLRLWNVSQGRTERKFSGHNFSTVAVAPDGHFAVSTAGLGREMRIWDLVDGGSLLRMKGHRSKVSSLTFSLDGVYIASGSQDKTIRLWQALQKKGQAFGDFLRSAGSTKNGQSIRVFQGHQSTVNEVDFSPNGRQLASASDDHTVRLWSVASGKLLHTFTEHKDAVLSVVFSANGRQLISGGADQRLIVRPIRP